jgi:hypothetical protein
MGTLVDPFLLVITLVMAVLIVIANVYFIAYYAHASDRAFGSSTALKVIVVMLLSINNILNTT